MCYFTGAGKNSEEGAGVEGEERKKEGWGEKRREREREGSLEGGDSGVCGCAVCLT